MKLNTDSRTTSAAKELVNVANVPEWTKVLIELLRFPNHNRFYRKLWGSKLMVSQQLFEAIGGQVWDVLWMLPICGCVYLNGLNGIETHISLREDKDNNAWILESSNVKKRARNDGKVTEREGLSLESFSPGVAHIIKASGEVSAVAPKDGKYFTLDEIQEAVGGRLEMLPMIKSKNYLIANEEGLLIGLPPNTIASAIASSELGVISLIVGDVLYADKALFELVE